MYILAFEPGEYHHAITKLSLLAREILSMFSRDFKNSFSKVDHDKTLEGQALRIHLAIFLFSMMT